MNTIITCILMVVVCADCYMTGYICAKEKYHCANEESVKLDSTEMTKEEKKARDNFMRQFENLMNYDGGKQDE